MSKNHLKHYRHLIALALVLSVAISGLASGIFTPGSAFLIVALWQFSRFAVSQWQPARFFISGLTPEQAKEFETLMTEMRDQFVKSKGLMNFNAGVRWVSGVPFVTDACAKHLSASFVLQVHRLGADSQLFPDEGKRNIMLDLACKTIGFERKTALTGTEIPLPVGYIAQIVELVFAYGAARKYATLFPLGNGKVKLPKLKAGEDEFGFIGVGTSGGMSQPLSEKRVAADPVEFDSNKAGGLIRLPFELEEDTFIPIGQFLARYIARQFARLEDRSLFLADGTDAFAGIIGVGKYCATPIDGGATPYLVKLDAAKTKVSDIALDDLRSLRGKVSAAVLANMAANGETEAAYYFHPSMEPLLSSFNKYPNFVIFKNENGKPTFDGWPVRWIGVSAVNNGAAQAGAFAAFFGALSYWYFGERNQMRFEISKEVFFASDELAMRAIERIDIQAMADDAMAALQLGAGA